MINTKDVICLKIPYPSIKGKLALKAHMYICKRNDSEKQELIKCQTLKPYMLIQNVMQHYCDEGPDISRNPFNHITRIDCDKLFVSQNIIYDLGLRTTVRPDVCGELYQQVVTELEKDGHSDIMLNIKELINLNPLVKYKSKK